MRKGISDRDDNKFVNKVQNYLQVDHGLKTARLLTVSQYTIPYSLL